MKLKTHLKLDSTLCGEVVELEEGYAKVRLETTQGMAADERGLIHGGFTFGAADFAAMAAVNDKNVVLVEATSRFLAPVVVWGMWWNLRLGSPKKRAKRPGWMCVAK